ncbi:aspartic peptidase domain-containing protein [Zychaea mexicana]|uniref:aspartic peptidase domain-containing protein n=1 Tax=Zychaea mexicana TaxID=64656 RepID=UPI0022FDFC22|nr:aspartic peptidase domain-containing protein [Zychaea mexicana]KAI9489954.1 aspartic peptidase domain-containing protein [Zychaea mexicana]
MLLRRRFWSIPATIAVAWILAASTVVGIVSAIAVANDASDSTITLTLLRNQPVLTQHRRRALLGKRQTTGSVETAALQNMYGREYSVEMGFGTPPQLFNVTIDTGSSTLWIASTECPQNLCPGKRYDPDQSSTYKAKLGNIHLSYAQGFARGQAATETVTIGENLAVVDQTFAKVESTRAVLTNAIDNPSSGILGLGFPALAEATGGIYSGEPFVFNLIKNNLIASPVFSVYMNSQYQYGYTGNAEMTFGGIDESKFTGQLQYTAVQKYTIPVAGISDEYLYWAVQGAGVSATSSAQGTNDYTYDISDNFVFDTGSTASYAPPDVVRGIVESLTTTATYNTEDQLYLVDCNMYNDENAEVTFRLADGINLTVHVRELIIPNETLDPRDAELCVFGILPMEVSPSGYVSYILGQTVMRSFYTVHDAGNYRMGFAPAVMSPMSNDSLNKTRPTPSDDGYWRPLDPSGSVNGNDGFGPYSASSTLGLDHMASLVLVMLVTFNVVLL